MGFPAPPSPLSACQLGEMFLCVELLYVCLNPMQLVKNQSSIFKMFKIMFNYVWRILQHFIFNYWSLKAVPFIFEFPCT